MHTTFGTGTGVSDGATGGSGSPTGSGPGLALRHEQHVQPSRARMRHRSVLSLPREVAWDDAAQVGRYADTQIRIVMRREGVVVWEAVCVRVSHMQQW